MIGDCIRVYKPYTVQIMKPPKCKTCGAEEWKHVCGPQRVSLERGSEGGRVQFPLADRDQVSNTVRTNEAKAKVGSSQRRCAGSDSQERLAPSPEKSKTDRKEYLRLKAIERRAAVKLGLTVKQYREKQKGKK